jgi:hypothetical protein
MKQQNEQKPISRNSMEMEPTTQRNTGMSNQPKERDTKSERTEPRNSRVERQINQSSEQSFPASDPPSFTPTRAGSPARDDDDDDE